MTTLKNVMLINAVSSGATGILLIVFSRFTSELFNVSETSPFIATGFFLLVFSLFVLFVSIQKPVQKQLVKTIIILDSLWVISSFLIIIFQIFPISGIGYLLIGGVALWVALMAYLQFKGLNQEHTFNT